MIYIYALCCPESGEIRYIGKTKNIDKRLVGHIRKARAFETKSHCANWIRSLLSRGLSPVIEVLQELRNSDNWQRAESNWIATYRASGFRLTNTTSGGDGFHDLDPEVKRRAVATWKQTMSDPARLAAFREALAASRRDPKVRAKASQAIAAAWKDPETRTRLMQGNQSPEIRAKRSLSLRRLHADPNYRARHSATQAQIWSTPERREEARQRIIKAHANPEISKRRVAALKVTYSSPVLKAKMSAINAEINARPEVKARKSETLRKQWADSGLSSKRRAALASTSVRIKMSARAKARWADPDKSKALLQRFADPESRRKRSEAAKLRATPEYREMMRAKTATSWIERKKKKLQ